ncbi:UNVERIFIED_CONTAM: hypothetical protein O8I53_08110, partial [Campylobacter lari]
MKKLENVTIFGDQLNEIKEKSNGLDSLTEIVQINQKIDTVNSEAQKIIKTFLEGAKEIFPNEARAQIQKFESNPAKGVDVIILDAQKIIDDTIKNFNEKYFALTLFNEDNIAQEITKENKKTTFSTINELKTYILDNVNKIKEQLKTYIDSHKGNLTESQVAAIKTKITNDKKSYYNLNELDTLNNEVKITQYKNDVISKIDALDVLTTAKKTELKETLDSKTTQEEINQVFESALNISKENINIIINNSIISAEQKTAFEEELGTTSTEKDVTKFNQLFANIRNKINEAIDDKLNQFSNLSQEQKNSLKNELALESNTLEQKQQFISQAE